MNEIEADNPGADDARHAEPARSDTPQVRTLLLTDLVDSTSLVERIGDGPAAELFRAHDRLVLELQQRWRGRLIDRSDGLLLLFERPVDALGFALDYNRGLRVLGERPELQQRHIVLQARAGLHVGEVLSWRNSEAAVQAGAKPLEVEGLAKPLAGRLMTLARPGQILLSATAEPLARRAARELGERSEHLIWKSHGRWRLKGMPDAQELFEVGEPGYAPLRAPKQNHAKAWRDIPLWRRPAALAAEVLLLVGMGTGLWFITKPQPAIAFSERDWVVVGDLRNLTGQAVLDESLEQAFRISLEQSRYVNVLSDMKARDTLARMQRKPDTALDRAVASEIAIRDGVRAVILPTVSEVGGRVRVSAEVIDPHTQTTVYAESADGSGAASTLDSIDIVTAALRGKLGEALQSIEKDSEPLPQVTTSNLDALRAYALGQQAYSRGQTDAALRFFRRATELEPQFALAWIGQVRAHWAGGNVPAAVPALRRALSLRERLPAKEAIYVSAWASELDEPAQATTKWIEAAELYPDFWPAQANAFIWLIGENRFSEAQPFVERTLVAQNISLALAYDELGRLRLATEEYEAAAKAFDQSLTRGNQASIRRRAATEAARRNYDAADRYLARSRPSGRYALIERLSISVDRGQWKMARVNANALLDLVKDEDGYDSRSFRLMSATVERYGGSNAAALSEAKRTGDAAISALSSSLNPDAVDDALLAVSSALMANQLGDRELSKRVLRAISRNPVVSAHPTVIEMRTALIADCSRAEGHAEEAVKLLLPFADENSRYETRTVLLEAASAAGQVGLALEQARWLQQRRGLAFIQLGCAHCTQAANLAQSNIALLREAELLARGNKKHARNALKRFDAVWPKKLLPPFISAERIAIETTLAERR